ncbi:conserved Plasmodium protein, unknown function [Plasmodium berghei]|uniref:Zinc finger protein, putative n=2 Tax=Plasmodium berghei TaxID=5821 RepID=A0A509ANY1_PLABA|nr:zinc finger protein, putative [Plasmodium berghei ANKA]CXI81868.1 conserved Plasmodium protein, unknown function [Plasmodium berghei]SCM25557.1 conserved Plasmodium protein, unknown function [Plasmodium berghei]SCN27403.1 conserved Plasmodium protein, unknown function [Plasmodium berghei]SCO62078.1 conserved Plasmodium protein, unknown function [Plasmodium berghei]SCO63830.1 conserved Plasmodium protein, unknown function [Plasmodium berghei]|eukprot:XP_034423036.1 zinc finger protein, putative [Plasmodium berghei ANKA]
MNKNKKKEKLKRKKKHTNSNLNLCKEINDGFSKHSDKSPNNKKEICNHNNTNKLKINNNDSSKKEIISNTSNHYTPENPQCVNKEGKQCGKENSDKEQNGEHSGEQCCQSGKSLEPKTNDELNMSQNDTSKIRKNNFEINSDWVTGKDKGNQHDDISTPVLKKIENTKGESGIEEIKKNDNSKVNKDEIYNLLNLNNMEEIEKNINYIFPSIDFDNNKSEGIVNVKNDDKKFEEEINKEINKFQKDIKDVYFHHNLKKGMKKNKCVNYEKNRNQLNSTCDISLKNIFLENEFVNFSEILIKGNIFLNLKKKIIKKKKKRKKKKSKTKLKTQNYKLIKELCLFDDAYTKETTQTQRKNEKRVSKYYIFEYSCGNTKIQSITGCIICYKNYEFYKNNNIKCLKKNIKIYENDRNNINISKISQKEENIFEKDKYKNHNFNKNKIMNINLVNEKNISVLLCVNVSNCISPSAFLELLYPCDNFIFFLKVLNKKCYEEYMIYFLTFSIYTKKILNKAKKIYFFNMKKKKKFKIYIVKGITMNVTSCITRNNNSNSYINTKKFYNIDLEKKIMCANNNNHIENIQLISNTNFINPFYLISQNKFQLSCAVCLEPLYSENLNKIISHIFNFSFQKKYASKIKCNKENYILNNINSEFNASTKIKKVKTNSCNNFIREEKLSIDIKIENSKVKKNNISDYNNKINIISSISPNTNTPYNNIFLECYKTNDKHSKEENKIQTYPSNYYYNNLNTLNNYNLNEYAYYLSVTNLINNMQNKYNSQMKRERKQNDKAKIFNNVPINILCSHIFHSNCLKKCCFTSCPICRYKQYNYEIANCDICKKNYNSKICLSCGFIGCSFNYDKIVKIKKKKIKEKKQLLKKKKIIIKKISYIFRKIIKSFMPIFNTIILSLYYKSKIKCVYKIRTNQICIYKRKKNKYLSTNYNNKQTNYITYYSDSHNKNKKIFNHKYSTPQNNNCTQNEKTPNDTLLVFSNNDNIYMNNLNKFSKYIYIGKLANKKKNVSYYFSQSINKCIIKKDSKKKNDFINSKEKKTVNKCKLQNKFFNTNIIQANNKKETRKEMNKSGKDYMHMNKICALENNCSIVAVEKYRKYPLKKKKKKINDHAKTHFYETQHNYFFDVKKNSVYDYSSDIYIKKLINLKIQNKKLKNIYNTGNIYTNGNSTNQNEEIINKKNIILYIYDFNQLLNALLESQRNSFLSCIHDLKINYENINMDNLNDINKCVKEIYILQEKNNNLKNEIKKKINVLIDKIKTNSDLSRELKNVETINAKLCADQRKQIYNYDLKNEQKKNIIKEKQQIIKELNKQITDLNFHKLVSSKFSQNSEITNSFFMIGEKITNKTRFKKR